MTRRKPELLLVSALLVIALPVLSRGKYSTRKDRGQLIVFESRGNASTEDLSPFDLQNAVDEALEQGIQALVFELDEFSFEKKLTIRGSLRITSRRSNSIKTELRCLRDNSMFDIGRVNAKDISVELRNVRITGCKTRDQEGAIHVRSRAHVVFEDVELVKNVAENTSHSIVSVDSNAKLEVRGDSSFSYNQGRVMLVGNGSEVNIENSSFRNNSADTNGTVLATRPGGGIELDIKGSHFEGNVARGSSGGVMCIESSNIVLANGAQFISNVAGRHGGALFLKGSRGLRITDALFKNNSCQFGKGGAIFIVPSNDSDTRIGRSVFTRNSANGAMGMGGAIAFGNTTINSTRQLELGSDVLFLKNTARVSGGAVIVYETRTRVKALSAFIDNSAQGAAGGLHMFSSETDFNEDGYIDANVRGASFVSNVAPLRGGGAVFVYGVVSMNMSNSTCSNNSGLNGGAVFVHDARRVVFRESCLFEQNNATKNGGSFYMERSYVSVTDCYFIGNEGERGGSMSIKDGETFNVRDCTFKGNSASNGGGAIDVENLETLRGHDTRTTLQHLRFLDNRSRPRTRSHEGFGGAMRLAGPGVDANVEHCLFDNNTAYWGGSLYLAEAFSTTFKNTNFFRNSADLGGALYIVPLERELVSQHDHTTFSRCNLRMNEADRGGAIFARPDRLNPGEISEPSNSLLNITDSNFFQNRASDVGGGLFLALMNTSFTGCSFRSNLVNRSHNENTGSSQVALRSSAGGAIYASDGSSLSVSDTNFIANSASGRGGAVCIDDALFSCTRSCTFQMNHGRNGGGMFCSLSSRKYNSNQAALLHCDDCFFKGNNAKKGGGIYASIPRIKPDAKQSQACQGSSGRDRTRAGKSSAREGCKDLVSLDPIRMQGNSAFVTGHDVFSTQPSAIKVNTEKGKINLVQHASKKQQETIRNYIFSSPAHRVTRSVESLRDLNRGNTGQAFGELEFQVLDSFNQSVIGSRIVVELWQCQNNSECCSSETKGDNEEENTVVGNVLASRIATNGKVNFEGLEVSDNRTGTSEFPLWACFIDEENEQVSLEPIFLNISFRDCYTMERRNSDGVGCSECDPGQYYANKSGNCTSCPEHATCRGLTIIPDAGYWHATSVSDKIHKCRPREACVEDKEGYRGIAVTKAHKERRIVNWTDSEYDQCNTGYEGIVCGSCKEDHGRWNDICTECLAIPLMWISLFVSIGWNLLVLLVFIYSARSLVNRARYNQQAASQHQRNQVSHPSRRRQLRQIQMIPRITDSFRRSVRLQVSLSGSTEVGLEEAESRRWIPSTRSILRRQNTQESIPSEPLPLTNPLSEALKIILNFMQVVYLAALLSEDLPSIFRWSIIPFDSLNLTETVFLIADCLLKGYEDRSIIRMTLQALFPIFLLLLICLLPALLLLFRKRSNFFSQELKLAILCTVYLYFGPEIRTLLKFLDEVKVEDENVDLGGAHFWSVDSSTRYLQGSHGMVVGIVVTPLFIALAMLFPFFLFVSLKKNKDRMQEEDVVSSYGFLYKGYEPKYYYWEIVIVIRKTVIAIVSVFVQNAELQSVLISLTLVLFLSLQLIVSPYSSDFPGLNILESFSLGVSTLMFLGVSLMLRSYELNKRDLLHTIAWVTITILFLTMVAMGMGLFAATHDFLNDQLIETKIYPDKKSLEDVAFVTKMSKLANFYFRLFYSRLAEKVNLKAPMIDAGQV